MVAALSISIPIAPTDTIVRVLILLIYDLYRYISLLDSEPLSGRSNFFLILIFLAPDMITDSSKCPINVF